MFACTCLTSILLCILILTAASQYHRNNVYVVLPVNPLSRRLQRLTHYNATKHCIDKYGYDARLLDFDNGFEVETLSILLRKLKPEVNVFKDQYFWSRQSDLITFQTHYAFQVKGNQLQSRVVKPNSEELPFACLASKCIETLHHNA